MGPNGAGLDMVPSRLSETRDALVSDEYGRLGCHWFTCTTCAGGKPLKYVLLAAE